MSIQTQIDRISGAVSAALTALMKKGVTVPDGTKVDDLAALIAAIGGSDYSSLKDVIERTAVNPTLPSDLTSIGSYAFRSCANLALTSLPAGLTSIGSYAFYGCSNLALTYLPDGLTSIGNYAFYDCTKLNELTFKGKPSSIPRNAFNRCTNLLTINVPWADGEVENAPWGAINATINYNYTGE